jgi:hypothetical protein
LIPVSALISVLSPPLLTIYAIFGWSQQASAVSTTQVRLSMREYTAIVKRDGEWWLGWIEEVPGVNCQERSHSELMESLRSALQEALELNREDALRAAGHSEISEILAKKICKDLGIPLC